MSDREPWLQARAAGRDLLLATRDLLEVLGPPMVLPMPARPKGIGGVVIHRGEFLPVLAWEDLPGGPGKPAPPVALAVLGLRLGLPLEGMEGTVNLPVAAWSKPPADDPWEPWIFGVARFEGRAVPGLDLDRLIALLRQFRGQR